MTRVTGSFGVFHFYNTCHDKNDKLHGSHLPEVEVRRDLGKVSDFAGHLPDRRLKISDSRDPSVLSFLSFPSLRAGGPAHEFSQPVVYTQMAVGKSRIWP